MFVIFSLLAFILSSSPSLVSHLISSLLALIRAAFGEILYMLITGGPLFFMFHIGTKAHYYEMTLLAGPPLFSLPLILSSIMLLFNAVLLFSSVVCASVCHLFCQVVPSIGRQVADLSPNTNILPNSSVSTPPHTSIKHQKSCTPLLLSSFPFHSLLFALFFACSLLSPFAHQFSSSHLLFFCRGLLIVYAICRTPGPLSYGTITWAAWLLGVGWLFAPFWFNPNAFDWQKNVEVPLFACLCDVFCCGCLFSICLCLLSSSLSVV